MPAWEFHLRSQRGTTRVVVELASGVFDFKDRFDLDGNISRQGTHADGAARADSIFRAEHIAEQFAATIDHCGMITKVRGRVDHAKDFDHALHTIKRTEFSTQRGEDRQASL